MQKVATRRLALVVLVLSAVIAGWRFGFSALAASQQDEIVSIYFPLVFLENADESSGDLYIEHTVLYQSVQDTSNDVTLVAHKPALLRIYAKWDGDPGNAALPVAEILVEGLRDGVPFDSLELGPQPISVNPSDDNMASTLNVELPGGWLEGELGLRVTIDPGDAVAEADESNNVVEDAFTFQEVAPLDLTIVPIIYVDSQTGVTFSEATQDPLSQWLLTAFPLSTVNVNFHTPYTFTGDLRQGDEWVRLLNEVTNIWATEVGVGSSHVYYGLIPNSTSAGGSWFSGGISGLGWIGQRVSIGIHFGTDNGESGGHEIGHNFGRYHAPCGNPNSVDPNFPYPNASIGVYGVDTSADTVLAPDVTHDMMSYCGPEWVSDYTYEGLYQDQFLRGGKVGTKGAGLLIRATVEGETLSLLPIYRLDVPVIPPEGSGDHLVQLLDDSGSPVATYPAVLFEAEELGVRAETIMAYVPASPELAEVATQVRILRKGEVVAERAIDLSDSGTVDGPAAVINSSDKAIHMNWWTRGTAGIVQFSPDGEHWSTIGSDIVSGRFKINRDHLVQASGWLRFIPSDGGEPTELEIP